MSVHPGRWQWQPSSESRWEWMPPETSSQLSAFQSEGLLTVQWQPFGDVEVDVGAGVAHLQGQQLGKVRQVPNWWGADANLAAGVLAACQVQDRGEVEFLLGVESRPWWPTRQVGPLWGFVEPDDRGLTSAMAREAFEESLGVLGSQDQLQACLDSEASAPVSFWPWQSQGRRSPQPAVLRMVNLGSLSHGQQDAVRESFRKRRHRALAAASLAVLATATGPTGSAQPSQPPASHLEVEELIWVNSQFLLQKVEDGQTPWLGDSGGGSLRGFAGDLLREGLRWKRSARFRDFCRGRSEARTTASSVNLCQCIVSRCSAVNVFVESVMTDKDGQQKLFLAMVKDKIGSKSPMQKVDLSGFTDLSADLWLKGTVTRLLNFGAFIRVEPPTGGQPAQGLIHINDIRDGFVSNLEEELSVDDEVQVRVKYVDPSEGVLQLSMLGS
ncbi:yugI [Symbiodinium natans]|uniref:YugI protein n=1 Tax=Symbiodinium natans TaxID=878477 RepID=A0A812NED4_9DINO|nr:yugI [Symbiodinium natans]